MKVVGVTGGIGSGKTTVCRIFELFGIPVFYADVEAKKLYDDSKIKSNVVKLFGKKILGKYGKVDRIKLASIVFSDKEALSKINSLIHPAVLRKFKQWKNGQKGVSYIIMEAAIMVESEAYKELDYLISINTPKKLIINRLNTINNLNNLEIKKRIGAQISDMKREKYADAVIINDGKHSLIEQTLNLHRIICAK